MSYDSRPDTWRHIHRVQARLLSVAHNLMKRAHRHDQSKLLPPEVDTFDEYTPKLRDTTHGSDEYRSYLTAMRPALEHHYAANSHHPEHHDEGIDGMTLVDLVEMLCDWLAAVDRHEDGDIFQSLRVNVKRYGIGPQLEAILRHSIPELREDEL